MNAHALRPRLLNIDCVASFRILDTVEYTHYVTVLLFHFGTDFDYNVCYIGDVFQSEELWSSVTE